MCKLTYHAGNERRRIAARLLVEQVLQLDALERVMSFLSPADLAATAQTCRHFMYAAQGAALLRTRARGLNVELVRGEPSGGEVQEAAGSRKRSATRNEYSIKVIRLANYLAINLLKIANKSHTSTQYYSSYSILVLVQFSLLYRITRTQYNTRTG